MAKTPRKSRRFTPGTSFAVFTCRKYIGDAISLGNPERDAGRKLAMLGVAQRLVQYAVVIYLVTHGLPVVSAAELRALALAVLAQLRISA